MYNHNRFIESGYSAQYIEVLRLSNRPTGRSNDCRLPVLQSPALLRQRSHIDSVGNLYGFGVVKPLDVAPDSIYIVVCGILSTGIPSISAYKKSGRDKSHYTQNLSHTAQFQYLYPYSLYTPLNANMFVFISAASDNSWSETSSSP